MSKQAVIVNIYDMTAKNKYLESIGLGIYHSGVVVFGLEYCYIGCQSVRTGIFRSYPTDVKSLGFSDFKIKESMTIGYTEYSAQDIHKIVAQLSQEFTGNSYHLFRRNCNHFTDAFIRGLCGKELPHWVNRLAYIGSRIPFLERALPKEMLTGFNQ